MSDSAEWSVAIEIEPQVSDAIEEHAYSNLQAEVGGMLVGQVKDGTTTIIGAVPAATAAAEQVSLTFTHEVWNDILREVDTQYPGGNIVGWYHTHPSFGLFLSQYDEFIQRNFFSSPGQVALVIDPIEGALAWFSLDDNSIVKFGEATTRRGSRSRSRFANTEGKPRGGMSSLKFVAITAVAVVVTAALVWGVGLAVRPPDATSALQQRNADYEQLAAQFLATQNRFGDIVSNPVLLYTVKQGDTVESLAIRFYESPEAANFIRDVNGLSRDTEIRQGMVLRLLDVSGVIVEDAIRRDFSVPRWEVPTPDPTVPPDGEQDGGEEPAPTQTANPTPGPTDSSGP